MSSYCFMGVDVGTTGVKAILCDDSGKCLGEAYSEHPLICTRPGWAEQDPEVWWQSLILVVRELFHSSRVESSCVRALAVTSQQPSPVFLDSEGRVLCHSLIWMDRRATSECTDLVNQLGMTRLYHTTGLRPDAMYGIYKAMWLKSESPDVYSRVRYILQPKDFVNYRLTGETASDYATSAAMQALELGALRWSEEILSASGICGSLMPPLYHCTRVLGSVSSAAAALLGLSTETQVVVSAGDTTLSALGCGVVRPGDAAIVIGTSSDVVACAERPILDEGHRIGCYPYVIPGLYLGIAGANSSGIALRWLRDQLLSVEGRTISYDDLTAEASRAPAGCDGLIFLPYLSGERSPVYDPNARGVYAGISLIHTRSHFVRAVMEGVALSIHDRLLIMRALEVKPERLLLSGGGSKSPLWRQIVTDMVGIPTHRMDIGDSALLGAVMVAAVGAGRYSSLAEACDKMVRIAEATEPSMNTHAVYARVYGLYKELYAANRAFFDSLAKAKLA